MIEIIKYIILGIVQGFTEPLPISSSGHVYLLKCIMNTNILNDLNFEIIVNFGSLVAILLLYKDDIITLIKEFFLFIRTRNNNYKESFKYCLLIMVGAIPIGIFGLLFKDYIEYILSNNIIIIGISFIITGVFLFIVKNIVGNKRDNDITYGDAFYIGIIQILALIPGISRSGSTLIAALLRNIKRDSALKYSFLIYIPISIGTMILGVPDIISSHNSSLFVPYTIGFIFSFIVSYFSLRWFKSILEKGKLLYFSLYCLLVGVITVLVSYF